MCNRLTPKRFCGFRWPVRNACACISAERFFAFLAADNIEIKNIKSNLKWYFAFGAAQGLENVWWFGIQLWVGLEFDQSTILWWLPTEAQLTKIICVFSYKSSWMLLNLNTYVQSKIIYFESIILFLLWQIFLITHHVLDCSKLLYI